MSLHQLISTEIPTLLPEDTGNRALEIMEENKSGQLPLVANDEYLALIQENDLLEWTTPDMALSTFGALNYKPAIGVASHPFEAMRIMHELDLSVLPVLDNDHKYAGTISRESIFKYIAVNSGVNTPGGIIVLEIMPRNYTLYEIARICENEDVIILNLQVHTTKEGKLEITLKVNRTAIDAVVSSFERHNYKVKEVYGEEANQEDIAGNYNLLMNYINM